MPKPPTHLSKLQQAAKKLGLEAKQIHSTGETMLGRTIYITNNQTHCYISSKRTGFYPEVPAWFKMICNSKYTSNLLLERFGYKTITSVYFNATKFNDTNYLKNNISKIKNYPVICKPEEGFKGQGIAAVYGVTQLRRVLQKFKTEGKSFLVQPIISDTEYRVLVVSGTVFVAHTKAMPGIIGDGKQTIESLLKSHSHVPQDQSFINSELRNRKLTIDTVLPKDELFYTHITRKGGSEIYIKDDIPAPIRKWSKRLCKDLQTTTIGIDVFIPDVMSDTKNYQIIEINASPGFTYLESRYKQKALVQEIAEHILRRYFRL